MEYVNLCFGSNVESPPRSAASLAQSLQPCSLRSLPPPVYQSEVADARSWTSDDTTMASSQAPVCQSEVADARSWTSDDTTMASSMPVGLGKENEMAMVVDDAEKKVFTREDEERFMRAHDQSETATRYLINSKFLQAWVKYINHGAPKPAFVINNFTLLDQNNHLRDDISTPQDYGSLNFVQWSFFQFHYGGGPSVPILHDEVDACMLRDAGELGSRCDGTESKCPLIKKHQQCWRCDMRKLAKQILGIAPSGERLTSQWPALFQTLYNEKEQVLQFHKFLQEPRIAQLTIPFADQEAVHEMVTKLPLETRKMVEERLHDISRYMVGTEHPPCPTDHISNILGAMSEVDRARRDKRSLAMMEEIVHLKARVEGSPAKAPKTMMGNDSILSLLGMPLVASMRKGI